MCSDILFLKECEGLSWLKPCLICKACVVGVRGDWVESPFSPNPYHSPQLSCMVCRKVGVFAVNDDDVNLYMGLDLWGGR